MESEEKEKLYKRLDDKEKKVFTDMILSATLGIFRGIDIDLYTSTTTEMNKFLFDFQSVLSGTDFSNNDLKILKSFLQQGRQIIEDIKRGNKDV